MVGSRRIWCAEELWVPELEQLPAYWARAGGLFVRSPDLLVVHSGSVATWVAEHLANPICPTPKPEEISRDGKRAPGRRLCTDGRWRYVAAAHISWYAGRDEGLLSTVARPTIPRGFVQQAPLNMMCWGAGGSICQGKGAVNARAIHVELPGPVDGLRPMWLRDAWRHLVADILRRHVPSLLYWTRHSTIDPQHRRDPGPGFGDDWMVGLGLIFAPRR